MHYELQAVADRLPCDAYALDANGHTAFLFVPSGNRTTPTPWVWYAPTITGHQPTVANLWMFRRLVQRGIAIAGVDVGESFGNPAGRRTFTAFHDVVVGEHRLSSRPVLFPQSRGGLMLYNWAAENPEKVAAVAGTFPVCDLRSYPGLDKACAAYGMTPEELAARLAEHNPVERLAPLAQAGVPILHVHGDNDRVVPLESNSGELVRRYRALGGEMELIVVPGKGHEVVPEFFECERLAEFAIEHALSSVR